ncbi:hypothetical protein B0H67DRAFT_566195 [Lasiosphaeris hirsuta]|uniref:Uncharacterized protein n=1 Tax=Lasiosphaeris hirsuta TaxID=260670 RepID=A0AA40E896_9PEZI|nr:hypothetical protein B0H67DRAFT_566195 [Lasiosphaeris hirsuta]
MTIVLPLLLVLPYQGVPSAFSYPLLDQTEPPYVANPSGRGTIGLVHTCVITLGLCLWTAMHPDVAYFKQTWYYGAAYKACWMISTAIFPEFVVCCAIAQLQQARDSIKRGKQAGRKMGRKGICGSG